MEVKVINELYENIFDYSYFPDSRIVPLSQSVSRTAHLQQLQATVFHSRNRVRHCSSENNTNMLHMKLDSPEVAMKTRWKVCCGAVATFTLLQVFIGWQWANPICNARLEYSSWVASVNLFAASAFLVTALNQIIRINVSTFSTGEDFDTLLNFYGSFCINMMSGTSVLLTYFLDWGGTCVSINR